LDRSRQKLKNEEGTVADLQKGRRVEVKFVSGDEPSSAEWVKVEVTAE
jgi:hypothetical protein